MPASHVVNFTSTFVVCAPKMFSVTPAPNAAPRPSLFGRCIRMTRIIRLATSTKSTRQKLISRFIGRRNMAKAWGEANAQHPTFNSENFSVGRWTFGGLGVCFNVIPDRVHLGQLHFAQFSAARFEFIL